MSTRVAVLDDYQQVALAMADWTPVLRRAEVDVFARHVADPVELVAHLRPYDIVVLMRERTPLTGEVIERLPALKLVVTTGRANSVIDVEAAHRRGIVVSGTGSLATAPVELTWALILALSRHLVAEANAMVAGGWQTTVGRDLSGQTLGVLGLGRIGAQVARVGRAFGMKLLAWSPNLTPERADEVGARAVELEDVLAASDVVTIHLALGERSRGLIGPRELDLMKPDALLVNTSRGPIVDEAALLRALDSGGLGGVGLDVFDHEPLPADHPLRSSPRTLLTPHLGYVTSGVYQVFFREVVEDIVAFLDGAPVRTL